MVCIQSEFLNDDFERKGVLYESKASGLTAIVFIRLIGRIGPVDSWNVIVETQDLERVAPDENYNSIELAEHAFLRRVQEFDGDKSHLLELRKRVYPLRLEAERAFYKGCSELTEHAWTQWTRFAGAAGYIYNDMKLIAQGYGEDSITGRFTVYQKMPDGTHTIGVAMTAGVNMLCIIMERTLTGSWTVCFVSPDDGNYRLGDWTELNVTAFSRITRAIMDSWQNNTLRFKPARCSKGTFRFLRDILKHALTDCGMQYISPRALSAQSLKNSRPTLLVKDKFSFRIPEIHP